MTFKFLNAFAGGIGGNRKLLDEIIPDLEVTAIENDPDYAKQYSIFYPDDIVHQEDAYDYVIQNYDEFDFIWASPPCKTHSITNYFLNKQKKARRMPDLDLFSLIFYLRMYSKTIPWIVENVKPIELDYPPYNEPVIPPTFILGRHYYWSNRYIPFNNYYSTKINLLNSKKETRVTDVENEKLLLKHFEIDNSKFFLKSDPKKFALRNAVNPKEARDVISRILKTKKKAPKQIKAKQNSLSI